MHETLKTSSDIAEKSKRLRADALDIIQSAIRAADPFAATKRLVSLSGDRLQIGDQMIDLRPFENIYVVGAGKATQGIALALEDILGDRITDGVVILRNGEAHELKKIRVVYASHPVPDEGSLTGAKELVELARKAQEHDLVISVITGGSSALAVMPPPGITLAEKQSLNETLLASGASIREINAVRKHVSLIKGGRLALEVFPATLIVLTVSDVVGDALDYITDLTVPDSSTYLEAWTTLEKYQLWDRIPPSIREHLLKGSETESPKAFDYPYHPFLVVAGDAAFEGAVARSRELGYTVTTIPVEIEGESALQARSLVDQALAAIKESKVHKPLVLIGRGETIVSLHGLAGEGGPNQEFALAAAIAIQGMEGIIVSAIDLDGNDGPTDYAGAIVDGWTVERAREKSFDAEDQLKNHGSTKLLKATRDLVYTGPTRTNVNDLMFVMMST